MNSTTQTTPTGRAGGERSGMSSAERACRRIDMALKYGNGGAERYPVDFKRRYRRNGVRGYDVLTAQISTALYCHECGGALQIADHEAPMYAEMDRIIPGTEGGSYKLDNILPACRHCNAERGDWALDPAHVDRYKSDPAYRARNA